MKRLFCFGAGGSAQALCARLPRRRWAVAGTARTADKVANLREARIEPWSFDGTAAVDEAALAGTTHLLVSVPPGEDGDRVLPLHLDALRRLPALEWVGYLSTTGVYGNRDGAWVDETSAVAPTLPRTVRRVEAERAWLDSGLPVQVFRLAGIYGPGRSAVDDVLAGTARRIDRPGHVFSRIHVDDIAGTLSASIARPLPGAIYNVCDDEPAEPRAVIEYAAHLLRRPLPPLLPFDRAEFSPMARSFWADHRRVRNERIKEELGVMLMFPSYREGLAAIVEALEIARANQRG